MRITFLLTQSIDSPSGLGRFGPLAHEIAQLGHKVSLFALNPNPKTIPLEHYHYFEGVDIRYVGPMHVIKYGGKKSYYSNYELIPVIIKSTVGLSYAALRTPADIIYVCKPQPMNSFAGILCHYLQSRLLCVDCDDYETASGNFSNRYQKSLVNLFESHTPLHAQMVTTNTHFMERKLTEWGVPASRIFYLPNGVEPSRFQNIGQEKIDALRHKYHLHNKKVIAFVGSLSLVNHPIELLIKAFAELHAKNPEIILLLVGGGESEEIIKQSIDSLNLTDHVRFTGHITADDIPSYYNLAHVTVDPVYDDEVAKSRAPLKMLESWAAGIPFVSANVGDRQELLGNPPAGLLSLPGNASSLANCLATILNNSELSKELTMRGFERALEFTFSKLGNQLAELFEQALISSRIHQGFHKK